MLPLSHYEQARRDAEFHVQVKIRHVQSNVATPGQARVDAEVIRIFRGQHALKLGDAVRFVVSVLTGNENFKDVPFGGTIWTNYNDLHAAKFTFRPRASGLYASCDSENTFRLAVIYAAIIFYKMLRIN